MPPISPETLDIESAPDSQTPKTPDAITQKRWQEFRSYVDTCKLYRRRLIANWIVNIDYRRGKPFASQTDEDRVVVNLDWSLTKQKQAALFSQVPQIHVDHPPQSLQAGPWLSAFEQRINDTMVVAGIETAMDECLPDCINAAGIGAVIVAHESITEQVEVPVIDPSTMPTGMMPDGSPLPTMTIPRILDHRYTITRISPSDLLWPITFTGADFDNSPWIGRSGRISWPQAQVRFNLTEADKVKCIADAKPILDRLTHDADKDRISLEQMVAFDEVFYKEYVFNTEAKSYSSIHHLVFVVGKDEPVIDEPWKGQKLDDTTGTLIGALRFPIRAFTLAYITDETIPPSDSAIGRPQVNEINRLRTQMIFQRERSLPVRWADSNRVDPTIMQNLMRGTWGGVIPVQGDGTRILGEVARANMPQDDYSFDRIAKSDISDDWGVGDNQQGSFGSGRQSAAEANIVQTNFSTRIGRERAKIAKFVVSIAEVLGGLLVLSEPPESFGQGFMPAVSRTLSYSILADSTVLLDSNQRLKRLIDFINFSAKSGFVDIAPVLKEIASLTGLDPNVVIKPPMPKPPVEPNISLRLTGMEDLLNPLALAFLMKSGQAPPADLIEQAKKLIDISVTPPAAQPTPPAPGMPPGPPGGGLPPPPGVIPPPTNPADVPPPPTPPAPKVGEAHPNWEMASRINKRGQDGRS